MKRAKSFIHSLTFNIIAAIAVLLLIFCAVASTIGYLKFTDSLTKEYTDSALRTADTAATLVKADRIGEYLDNSESIIKNEDTVLVKEYNESFNYLNILCDKQNVTVIYVIAVASDYGSYTCVFNCPNKNSGYTPWEIGKVVETSTTAGTYREIYKNIYENGQQSATVMRTKNLNGAAAHITSLIPLTASDGTVAGIMCVQRPMSELIAGRVSYMILVACFTFGLAVLFIAVSVLFMKKQFVNPIKKINAEAARFAEKNCAPDTPLSSGLSKINEISELAASISDMESETLKYIENLSEVISEKQRMGTELQIASLIQEGSIPSVFPAYPGRKEFDLFASMTPAKEVGGDFYDFFFIDDDHLAIVIADVSGKGVPAALFMMVTKILINNRSLMGGTPAEILSFVNDRLYEHNKAEMFVTVWLGILEISTGTITAANAGHDDPAVFLKGEDFIVSKQKHGLVMGAMNGAKYKDFQIKLNKGDKIFLYTDGVVEATDKDENLFKVSRMLDALNEKKDAAPKSVIENVRARVDGFVGDAPQFDDITMLCLEFKGAENCEKEKRLSLAATDENLGKALEFINDCLSNAGCSAKFKRQIELAAEEVYVNVAHYAYSTAGGDVEISVKTEKDKAVIAFIDQGKPFNPLEKPDPDTELSAEKREVGGLGVYMVKNIADKLNYEYKDGKNIFIMEKNFE